MYTVYILICRDQSLYTGLTTDLSRRLAEHQSGGPKGARYTRARLPVALLWHSAPLPDRSSAAALEWRLKRLSAAQKRRWIAEHPVSDSP
ncbi:MAG: GIY-YIG nuclease family protein [Candidatus Sericytochromatia bacterium]